MKLVPTQEEVDLRRMLSDLLAAECPTTLVRALRDPGADRSPGSLWKSLTASGVLGLPFAEEYGGMGGRLDDVATYLLEAGRALAPTVVASTLGFGVVADRLGDDAWRARLLPPLAAGELRGVAALADPADAGDVRPRLTGVRAGERWKVTGRLTHVADVDLSDCLLTTAAAGGRTVAVLVDPAAEGVTVTPLDVMGGPGLFAVGIDDVTLDPADVSGALDREDLVAASHTLAALRCVELVGVAEEALRHAVNHASSRHQFGRPIGSFQAAQHLVADMHIGVQAARLSALAAVSALGEGEVAVRESAVARMHAVPAAKVATLDAHQLHGGMGYVLETDLHLWSERARVLASLDGSADTAAAWLAEEVGLVRD